MFTLALHVLIYGDFLDGGRLLLRQIGQVNVSAPLLRDLEVVQYVGKSRAGKLGKHLLGAQIEFVRVLFREFRYTRLNVNISQQAEAILRAFFLP